jgi:hypothetical protein
MIVVSLQSRKRNTDLSTQLSSVLGRHFNELLSAVGKASLDVIHQFRVGRAEFQMCSL